MQKIIQNLEQLLPLWLSALQKQDKFNSLLAVPVGTGSIATNFQIGHKNDVNHKDKAKM